MRPLLLTVLLTCAAFSADQGASGLFSFGATESQQDMQEIATVIRSTTDIPQLSVSVTDRNMAIAGDAAQVAAAEWLFNELDKPRNRPPVTLGAPDPSVHEYSMPGGGEDTLRVLYAPGTANVQQFQELATVVRSIAQIRRVFIYNTPRAIVLRGTAAQVAMDAWLVENLDQPPVPATQEYRAPDGADDVVRILYLPHTATVQDFQQVATAVRAMGDIRFTFTYTPHRALALRGTSGQMTMAAWLASTLDQRQAPSAVGSECRMSGVREDTLRVFYLPRSLTVENFQQSATSIGKQTEIRRVFVYNSARALIMRGTAEQIALAEKLVSKL